MKPWHKALIATGAVLVITVACIRIAAPEMLGKGYNATDRVVRENQIEAAEKAVASIKPEDFQAVNSFVRQAHFQLNDLVASGHYKRFTDSSAWASSSKEYLWEERVKSYVSGDGEFNFVASARQAAEKVGAEDLKADLETFARMMELAYEKKDVHLLILAHRIVHDLDYWVFNNEMFKSRDYWGATITLEGKEGSSVKRLLDSWPDYKERILPGDSIVEADASGRVVEDFSPSSGTK